MQNKHWNNATGSRFPFYFDLRLSSHSLIHTDRSRLREQTRALWGVLQSSIGQLHRNAIHMFYRQGLRGGERAVNASKRQNLPPQHHHCSSISWPTASRPSKPQPWHRMSDCSRKCFRGAVKVYTMGVRGNDLRCCRAALTVQEFGAQWVKIQVQVIAGWMGDRQPGEMRIRLTLWSEDQEAFIALEQWLVMTGHSSLESFSHFSVKTLFLNSAMFFISFLSSSRFKNQRV